jgi:hypothetical protein
MPLSNYRSFRRWVDERQAGGLYEGKLLYVAGALPMFATPIIGNWWLIPSGAIAMAWMGFLVWRFLVMASTGYVGGDLSDLRDPKTANPDE